MGFQSLGFEEKKNMICHHQPWYRAVYHQQCDMDLCGAKVIEGKSPSTSEFRTLCFILLCDKPIGSHMYHFNVTLA